MFHSIEYLIVIQPVIVGNNKHIPPDDDDNNNNNNNKDETTVQPKSVIRVYARLVFVSSRLTASLTNVA